MSNRKGIIINNRRKALYLYPKIVKYIVTLVSCVTLTYIVLYSISKRYTDDISCHDLTINDDLPSTFSLPEKNIFFHETSCRGGLNSRQACAVESAARAHPQWQINVFFSSPVHNLKQPALKELRSIPNIKLIRLHIKDYAKGTPLEDFILNGALSGSYWPIEHTADILRYLTLYKFGGVYLDTDTVVVRSLDSLPGNWAGIQDGDMLNNGVLALSIDAVGRDVSENILREVKVSYKPKDWDYNGPLLITRVANQYCSTRGILDTGFKNCDGFYVYGAKYFFPVYYSDKEVYFNPGKIEDSNVTFIHHLWNKLTHNLKVDVDSPYAELARKFCPSTYSVYGDDFGN